MSVDKKKRNVYIRCNSSVKKFSMERVRQLGIDVGLAQLYVSLSKDGFVSCKRDARVVRLAEKLIKIIPGIRPRIMMTAADVNELTQFITKWKIRVSELMEERQYTPVYYEDIVNSLLLGKSDIKCSRVHLEWCLAVLGPKNMKPGKIVDEILKHESQEWAELLPLAYDDCYSVRLEEKTDEIQTDFRKRIEFIYRLSNPALTDSIIDKLEQDIRVVNDMKHLREKATANYRDMIKEYLDLINSLQTIIPSILPKKLIRKMEGIVSQKEDITESSKVKTKSKPKTSSAKSDGTTNETSTNHYDVKKAPVVQHLHQKEDEDVSSLPFKPDDDSTPIVNAPSKDSISDYPDEVPGEPGDDELNYRDLMEYLNEKVKDDSTGKEKLDNGRDVIFDFCKLENFDIRFAQLKTAFESPGIKYPGGFAVGEMRKMLDPNYTPKKR